MLPRSVARWHTSAFLLIVGCLVQPITARSAESPHVIFIVADDLGWDDVSFHGSEISTPNIDELARSGIILNNYYVQPICTPTRSTIMTGRHPIHTGLQHGVIQAAQPYGLGLNETLMPEYLKKLGYATHIVGKWHLGFFQREYTPLYRGFDSHYGYWSSHEDYFDHTTQEHFWGLDFHRGLSNIWSERGNYSTELFTAEVEKIIRSHNMSQPLFLYLAHQAVHAGNQAEGTVEAPAKYVDRFPNIGNTKRRTFAGMVSALDDSVGNITRALRESGMMENSVVIFTTDNGGPANGYDGNAACNYPLRGTKNTMWEGGVRGTGFVYSPLLKTTGYISSSMMHVADWLPTVYRVAGGDPETLQNIDGYNMWDSLSSKGPDIRHEILHNIDPIGGFASIRLGDYKLVTGDISRGKDDSWYGCNPPSKGGLVEPEEDSSISRSRSTIDKGSNPLVVECGVKPANASLACRPLKAPCLFHIPSDPCEYNNLADQNPEIVTMLEKRIEAHRLTSVPPRNKPYDPASNPLYHEGAWVPWMD